MSERRAIEKNMVSECDRELEIVTMGSMDAVCRAWIRTFVEGAATVCWKICNE